MIRFQTAPPQEKSMGLEDSALDAFADAFRGEIVCREDDGYDDVRALWNGMIDKHPAAIARCTDTADVVTAVNFAREHDLLISVRGGGHNVAGKAVCDDGLMIDLSPMKGIHVDPRQRTARAQPGVDLGALDRETQLHGLATPTGIVSKTGLAGLTLGGGFGWLTRQYGFTVDNLLSAEIVTADGRVVHPGIDENGEVRHEDLFWAIRGGGGNFGIATSFEYGLHPVGPTVLGGPILHPLEKAGELLRFYRDFAAGAPEKLGSLFVMRLAPPAPFLPSALHGEPICGLIVCYAGDLEEGERVLAPLRAFGEPLADKIGPKSYVALQSMLDEGQPEGEQYYWKSEYLSELDDDLIATAVEYGATIASPLTRILLMQLGGAAARVDEMATAASHRDAQFVMAINSGWRNPAENERQIGWTRDFWREVRPYSTGVYVNFLSADEGQNRVRAAYGEEKYERLVAVKNRYDSTNLFRLNQNIKPTPALER